VIRRAIAKRPEDRYGSAREMLDVLNAVSVPKGTAQAVQTWTVSRLIALPFRVLKKDEETGFLAYSLPDAISSSLSGVDSLIVRSSLLAARFEGLVDPERVAERPLRSKHFYAETLGFPLILEKENRFIFLAGSTAIGVRGPENATPKGDVFIPFRIGLDHLALACTEEAELHTVAAALMAAGIQNTGVKLDTTLNKRYVAFKDPDGIAWELYM
jgi:catechol 2,3-dioxygenase-like lactoylglutathione lyase family enzyme